MKCPFCHSDMTCKPEDYPYIESGLDNLIIKNLDIYRCKCGESIISIPALPDLHRVIGMAIIRQDSLLSGKEIRFLRKNIGLTATRLAKIIGADIATISRWENDAQAISKEYDRILRLVYADFKGLQPQEKKELLERFFPEIIAKHKTGKHLDIHPWMWTKQKASCHETC
ncbi:MAG: type II toxin-antitoxin system MqsA family antitoxin [Desulfobacterales bacterium]|nr:type II toxin-antitoxin system MqsA family antitoxin [Desulfobacterales bacterium]